MTRNTISAACAVAATALAFLPTDAGAQVLGGVPVLQERNIPLVAARQIAQGAVEACAAKGYNVSASVVDRAGVARAVLRADRADPDTAESAVAKAYTSASLRNGTLAVAEAVERNPAQRNLGQIQGFLLVGGGLPVRVADEVIGAVGVSGAPSGQADEGCARAGIERAQSATAPTSAQPAAIAGAQGLLGRDLSLSVALQIAQGAVDSCSGRGFNVAAAVVDRAGAVRALLRADRAGPHTPGASSEKAFTSVVLRDATSALVEAGARNPGREQKLNRAPRILLLGGGIPVRLSNEIIGAVGAGGAPSGQTDEECARAGIAAAGLGLS